MKLRNPGVGGIDPIVPALRSIEVPHASSGLQDSAYASRKDNRIAIGSMDERRRTGFRNLSITRLLIDASTRAPIIVTTHSPDLISDLWECPDAVVVCERGLDGTTLKRLDPERMSDWLERYTLGHIWRMGEIGGNRW